MFFSKRSRCGVVTALVLLLLAGCDMPTGEPSINTEVEVNAPVAAQKTFSFLGGDKSEFEPLIDTTTSDFDSLFTVGDAQKDISIVQRVDNFDIGTLNGALSNASGDLSFESRDFAETFIDLEEEGIVFPGEQRIGDVPGVTEEDLKVSASGTIVVSGNDRVAFDKTNDDFVELGDTRVKVQNVTISPNAEGRVFDNVRYVYPDVRVAPYGVEDVLLVEFVSDPCGEGPCGENGEFERDITDLKGGFSLNLQGVRVYPDKEDIDRNGKVQFEVKGRVNEDLRVEDDDKISLGVETSIENFEIQEIKVSEAKPFAVNVTPNADGGTVDIADENEVETASFDGFGGITDRVDGFRLTRTSLDYAEKLKNLVSTDA